MSKIKAFKRGHYKNTFFLPLVWMQMRNYSLKNFKKSKKFFPFYLFIFLVWGQLMNPHPIIKVQNEILTFKDGGQYLITWGPLFGFKQEDPTKKILVISPGTIGKATSNYI